MPGWYSPHMPLEQERPSLQCEQRGPLSYGTPLAFLKDRGKVDTFLDLIHQQAVINELRPNLYSNRSCEW